MTEQDDTGLLSDSSLMLTILRGADEREVTLSQCADQIEADLRVAGVPGSIARPVLMDGLAHAAAHLLGAGLIIPVDPRRFRITPRGRRTLIGHPDGVDDSVLLQFREFQNFVRGSSSRRAPEDVRPAEFHEGYNAFQNGRDLSENPFRFDTAKHLAWENGWSEARDDRDRSNPGTGQTTAGQR